MKINVIVIIVVQDTLVLGSVGHIARHLQKCIAAHNKDDNTDLKQSKLHVGPSSLVNCKYNTDETKEG